MTKNSTSILDVARYTLCSLFAICFFQMLQLFGRQVGFQISFLFTSTQLVLDEPFNALDEKSVKLFRELLIEYKKQEKLIILTSHNKEDIESLCDHTYQIQSGQIIAE